MDTSHGGQPHCAPRFFTDHLPARGRAARLPEPLQKQLEGFSLLPHLEGKAPPSWHDDRMLFVHAGRWTSGMAAAHKYYKAAVLQGHMMLIRTRACGDPACNPDQGGECLNLLYVQEGAKSAIYTKENAQFHWGVTPPDHWCLFDLQKDPACTNDLADKKPDLAKKLATAYEAWWDDVYPVMIARNGDVPLEEGPRKKSKKKPSTPAKQENLKS